MKIIVSWGIVLGLLGVATTTLATGFIHKVPGQECVMRESVATRPYYYGTHARNDSASLASMYCPIRITGAMNLQEPVNEWSTGPNLGTLGVTVKVEDWNSGSNFACYLRVCDADESVCTQSDTSNSSGSTGTIETLTLQLSSADLSVGGTQVAHFKCEVPAKVGSDRSGIVNYTYNQHP